MYHGILYASIQVQNAGNTQQSQAKNYNVTTLSQSQDSDQDTMQCQDSDQNITLQQFQDNSLDTATPQHFQDSDQDPTPSQHSQDSYLDAVTEQVCGQDAATLDKDTSLQQLQGCDQELQNFLDHIDDQAKISFQHFKIFLTDSAGAGKTSFRRLLLRRKFKEGCKSTDFQNTKHAYAVVNSASLLKSKECGKTVWLKLTMQQQIDHCRSLLQEYLAKKDSQSKVADKSTLSSIDEIDNSLLSPPASSSSLAKEKIIESKGLSKNLKICGTMKLLTIVDTGGQPGYIHLLPVFNCPTEAASSSTFNFIVHNMTRRLDEPVIAQYQKNYCKKENDSKNENDNKEEYELPYTNYELIKQLTSIASEILHSKCNSKSYIGFVGTHKDRLAGNDLETTITSLNQKLSEIVQQQNCGDITISPDNGHIFQVNNKTAGSENEDEVAEIIRNKIQTVKQDEYPLPIFWVVLELEVKLFCESEKREYISVTEYFNIAQSRASITDESSIKFSIQFFHQMGHYTELSDYIIVNQQWFYFQLSKIIGFHSKNVLADKTRKNYKTQGILPAKELDVEMEGDLKLSHFFELLCNKKIMARYENQGEEYYYIPYFLPYSQPYEDKYKFLLLEPGLHLIHAFAFQEGFSVT